MKNRLRGMSKDELIQMIEGSPIRLEWSLILCVVVANLFAFSYWSI